MLCHITDDNKCYEFEKLVSTPIPVFCVVKTAIAPLRLFLRDKGEEKMAEVIRSITLCWSGRSVLT